MKVRFQGVQGGIFEFEGSQIEFETLMEHFEPIRKWVDLEDQGKLTQEKDA